MKKFLKIGCLLLVTTFLALSQMNLSVFAIDFSTENEQADVQSSANNTEANEVAESDDNEAVIAADADSASEEEAPLMAKAAAPFAAGFASFDGVDLSGDTNLSYTQGQIINVDKTVSINVNFGDTTSSGKKVTVQLAKEFVFQTVPGLKRSGNTFVFDPASLPSNLQGFVSNITYTPNPTSADSWNGYGNAYSGSITYEFIDSIAGTPISFTTRIDRFYLTNEAGYNINNAVVVTSEKAGNVIETEAVETLTYATPLTADLWRGGEKLVYVDQTTGLRTNIATLTSKPDGFASGLVEYYEVTYAYSKELAYVSTEGTTIPNTGIIDTEQWSDASWNYIKFRFTNAKITGNLYLNFDVADTSNHVIDKVYTIKPSGNQTVKPYDNPAFEINRAASFTFKVTEGYKNKIELLDVSQTISLQNADTGNAVLGQIPIRNRQSDAVTDQTFKLTFDDVYMGVNRIDLYTTSNVAGISAYNISGTTTDGRSFTIPDINNWVERSGVTLANSDITANSGEYIKTLTWTEKSIANNFVSANNSLLGFANLARYYGDILDSAANGTVATSTLQSVSVESGEDINTASNQAILTHRYVDTATALGFGGNGTTINMLSGETKTVVNALVWNDTQGTFVSTIKGFNFYLREADAFEFDISSFVATDTNGVAYSQANGNIVVSTLTDNTGKKVYKITAADYAFDFRKSPNFKVNVTTKKSAGNFTIQAKDIYFAEPMNPNIVLRSFTSGASNYDIYDVSDLRNETQQMFTYSGSITNLAQADFSTATSANLDGGPWTTYDYASGKTILDLNPDGTAKYKLSVANNSGQNVSGYKAIIPIPKMGENAGTDFQKQDFEWDVLLNNVIDVSSTNYAYTVRYSTVYTNNFDDASWKTWNEITDKTTIKAVRIVTTDVIPDGGQDAITFNIDMDPATADLQAGGVNIYNALIYRSVLGAEGAVPSEPVAIRLKTGVVKGQVFNDTDRNGLMNGGETGRNGVVVTAYEAGTTTVLETKTTQTIDGVPGSYAFLGLDKDQNVDIVFTNPTNDDSIRFSAVTSGGSTPTATATHDKATTANITPSSTGYDSIDAGFITPVTVTFNGNTGVSSIASAKKYPGEAITPAPTATKKGYRFLGWYTAATAGSQVAFPYTVGTADVTLYAQFEADKYIMSYDIATNGGLGTKPADEQVTYDTLVTKPADAVKTGYTFTGWFDAATDGTKWDFATNKMPANDMKLYAQFTINSYTMTFDNEGATTTQTVVYDTVATEPTAPTKTGFTFAGWFDAQTGGTKWNFATDKMPAANKTLYAQYTRNNYTVTFNDQGTTTTQTVAFDALVIEPATVPTKAGYTFAGWFDAATGGTKWNFGTNKMPATNKTLHAQFTADDQTITFDVNGGNVATQPADLVQPTDSAVDLDAVTAPTWFGHKFLGWKDAADVSYNGTITMPAGGLNLIAEWQDLIADGTWQIEANDITISYSELVAMIQSDTLDDEILARSGAKAWDNETLADLSPLYVKDLTTIKANPAVGSYALNVYHDEAAESIITTFASTTEANQLNTDITLTVTENPAQPQLPVTGQNYLEFIGIGIIAVIMSGLLALFRKKSDK